MWDEEEIKARAEWLCEQARILWNKVDCKKESSEQISPLDVVPVEKKKTEYIAEVERKFNIAMKEIYETAKRECKYNASRFIQLVAEKGGVVAAKQLICKDGGTEGFTTLWEHGRLDLSVEAHVLQEEYSDLFSDDEKNICRERLKAFGYKFD